MKPGHSILLLGGAGFVGRALCRDLLHSPVGAKVTVVSRGTSPFASHARLRYRKADVADPEVLAEVLAACDTVVYLACDSVPASTVRSPVSECTDNLMPVARFAQALLDAPGRRVLFISSGGSLYGNPASLPVAELLPAAPVSFHGAGKLAAEHLLRIAAEQAGHDLIVLRPSNIYGPGQALRKDFGVVRKLLEHACSGEPFDVWGDGRGVRDYLYIQDFVEACRTLIEPEIQGRGGRTFNVGTGIGVSLNQLIGIVEKTTGRTITRRFHDLRASDVRGVVLDSGALRTATGWRPRTELVEGIGRTWAWLQEHKGVGP